MKKSYIVVALILFLIVVASILLRSPLRMIFTTSETAAEERAFNQANKKLDEARAELESLEGEVKTQQDIIKEQEIVRDNAVVNLEKLGEVPEAIEKELEADKQPLRVEVLSSQAKDISSGISLSGQAEASRKLDVRAETSGQIISEPLPSGSSIKEGEVLCQLDPGTSQASLDQAKAALATAQTEYNSAASLFKRGLASRAAVQNANAALEQAQAAVENAENAIGRLNILAPFDGVLESQTAELGELLQPGSLCASIVALDRLVLVGYASETQVDKIRVGAPAQGKLRDGREVLGKVSFIATSADPTTRTYRVEISLESSAAIRDGASANISITLAGVKGHLLPQNVLTLDDTGDLGIKISSEGFAEFIPVELVRDTNEGIWVTGLPEMADVIIAGQEFAVDGQEIEAVMTSEAP